FVELYNLSGAAVNVGGWKIRGSNASGTVGDRATIPAGTMIPPGCYYLFTNRSTSGGPYSGAVPGDQTYATGITDDGGLALTLPDNTIVDQVGMTAGSAFKEGTVLGNLGTSNQNRSWERRPGGASGGTQDTDNNAADFMLISPSTPQNSASTCVGGAADPSGIGASDPSSVEEGQSSLLTVAVMPGSDPTSTGLEVTADLSAIGGSVTQIFFDDGTNGDVTPDDDTFSWLATVAAGTSSGAKNLLATITDAQGRSGSATITVNVVPPLMVIHTIQGAGNSSPFDGQLVRTRGIVTARKNNGFFLQTADSAVDGDPNTSEGIFVFTLVSPPIGAAVSNEVEVTGFAQEFIPGADPVSPPITEISGPGVTVLSTGNALPAPMIITAADTSPAGAVEQLERLESMRVHVDALMTISPSQGFVNESQATGSSNGVFYAVVDGIARPFREPGIDALNLLPPGTPCCVPRFDGNPERVRLDSDGQQGAAALAVTSGATLTNVTGVLDFGFRTYTILPDPGTPPAVSGLAMATALPIAGRNEFTVSSMNLQRFFDTVNDPMIGDPVLTAAAFNNRLNKISMAVRNVMNSPDIIGVQEAENLSGLQALADRVNNDSIAATGTNPAYQAFLMEGNDPGGIDVGFLVKTSRVVVNSVTQEGLTETFIDPNNGLPDILNDRPPLVLRATVVSTIGPNLPVTVIVNHLRSFIDIEDPADGNRVRTKRRAQAEFLANLVQARQAADPSEEIILVGDFNAFQFNDGLVDVMGALAGSPAPANEVVLASPDLVDPDLANLVHQAAAEQRYSFTFDGHAQVLDQVLVTSNLTPRFSRFHYARNNADFPETFRNDATRPERYSDHDVPVAYFALPPITVQIDIKPGGEPNSINLGSNGNVPVAILSTPDFDAGQVDPTTVTLAGAGVRLRGRGTPMASLEDVNGDGLRDLVLHITTQALQLTDSDTQAVLEGMTFGGMFIRGTDTVRIVP
ncbi:MAG: lamin tail domain-containing protein, partial [Candidatus Acidiferrales bacterium]